MNERIQELDNQAYEYALAESKGGTNICAPGSDYFLAMEKAKFAELIVKECGNWFNSRLVVEPDYSMEHRIERNRAVVGVMKEFNQHFGVEQ